MTQLRETAESDGFSEESGAARVASAAEDVRLAEARLHRRRQRGCGPSTSMREALRRIHDAADAGDTITPSDLAKAMNIKGSSVTHITRRLISSGLILSRQNDDDRRSQRLVPMDRRLDTELVDPLNQAIRTLADDLNPRDAAVVASFLEALATLVDDECR